MATFSDDKLADLREQLHEFMMGFGGVQAGGMAPLVRADWALAARVEQLRRHPLVSAFDDELLAAVAARTIAPNVEARYLAKRLSEVEAEIESEPAARTAATVAAAPVRDPSGLPPLMVPQMEATIALIARDELGVETLEVRGRDHLDFHSCSVWSLRAALVEAYEEGWHAAP